MRPWPEVLVTGFIVATLCGAETLKPSEALDRYLADQHAEQMACSDSVFSVQIDASLPSLKKQGSMTGFKKIGEPGRVVYRGLRFTGDNLVKTQVIARFLARDTQPPKHTEDVAVTPRNYIFAFDRTAEYNGVNAYVFLLKPSRKRAGLFRGELWLDAQTAAPLRLWGDVVKSPSVFVRSFRFVKDYPMTSGCTEPLRLLLTARTLIAGEVEMTVWLHPASDEPEATGRIDPAPNFNTEAMRHNEVGSR